MSPPQSTDQYLPRLRDTAADIERMLTTWPDDKRDGNYKAHADDAAAYRWAADEIEQLRTEVASWKAVAHDHSERLKVIGVNHDIAVQDVLRLVVAIRAYVAARLDGRGELAAHWWTLQNIAKEFVADVPDITNSLTGE